MTSNIVFTTATMLLTIIMVWNGRIKRMGVNVCILCMYHIVEHIEPATTLYPCCIYGFVVLLHFEMQPNFYMGRENIFRN